MCHWPLVIPWKIRFLSRDSHEVLFLRFHFIVVFLAYSIQKIIIATPFQFQFSFKF